MGMGMDGQNGSVGLVQHSLMHQIHSGGLMDSGKSMIAEHYVNFMAQSATRFDFKSYLHVHHVQVILQHTTPRYITLQHTALHSAPI